MLSESQLAVHVAYQSNPVHYAVLYRLTRGCSRTDVGAAQQFQRVVDAHKLADLCGVEQDPPV